MKTLVVLVIAVIATAYSQEICCMPEVFEIRSGGSGRIVRDHFAEDDETREHIAFDHNRQIKAFEVERHVTGSDQPRTERYRLVEDYNKDASWHISEGECKKYSLGNATMHRCTPPGSVFQETFYVGDRQLAVDNWLHQREDNTYKGFGYLSYVQGNCVPYAETFKGERINPDDKVTEKFVSSRGFTNFQKGILDPERFFNIPSDCPK